MIYIYYDESLIFEDVKEPVGLFGLMRVLELLVEVIEDLEREGDISDEKYSVHDGGDSVIPININHFEVHHALQLQVETSFILQI
jgi:hypothetical protein